MAEIIHRIGIASTAEDVYQLLTTDEGLSLWWTTDTQGAGDIGSIITFNFNTAKVKFRVTALVPNQRVQWQHTGDMPDEWIGTEISFELTYKNNQTYVLFKHMKWRQASDFMGHCSCKWAVFLLSLKNALENGKGNPFPNDIHIEHGE